MSTSVTVFPARRTQIREREEGLQYGPFERIFSWRSPGNKPVWSDVLDRGLCGGGCYHEAYTQFGDGALPNLHYCDFSQGVDGIRINVYMKLQGENPGFIEAYVLAWSRRCPKE